MRHERSWCWTESHLAKHDCGWDCIARYCSIGSQWHFWCSSDALMNGHKPDESHWENFKGGRCVRVASCVVSRLPSCVAISLHNACGFVHISSSTVLEWNEQIRLGVASWLGGCVKTGDCQPGDRGSNSVDNEHQETAPARKIQKQDCLLGDTRCAQATPVQICKEVAWSYAAATWWFLYE